MKLRTKLNKIREDSFSKGFLTLLGGSLLGQLINVLVSPILTRIFSPEDFGYFGTFSSLISIMSSVTTLKMEMALPIKSDNISYNKLFWIIFLINFILSGIIGGSMYLLPFEFYNSFHLGDLYNFLWLLPFSLFFTGVNRLFNSAVVRFKAFSEISRSFLNQMIAKNVFQISFGYFFPTAFILILGIIFNQITALSNLIRVLRRHNVLKIAKFSFKDIKEELRLHKDYIIFGTPSSLANSLGLYIPVPLILYLYGPSVAGSLSFGITLISLPMKVIGMSLSQVFIGETSELIRDNKPGIDKVYNGILKKLVMVTVLPTLIIMIFGDRVFPLVFGSKWQEAGVFIQLLSISYGLQFISSPLSQILNLLVLQRVQFYWDVLRMIVTFICLYLPYYLGYSSYISILWFSIGMSCCYLLLIFVCKKYIGLREKQIVQFKSDLKI